MVSFRRFLAWTVICIIGLFSPVFSQSGQEIIDNIRKNSLVDDGGGSGLNNINSLFPKDNTSGGLSQFSTSQVPFTNSNNILMDRIILDKPVDEDEYRLGSNDELAVYIWGESPEIISLVVNAEGNVIIPHIGVVAVRGLSLAEGKTKIRGLLENAYKKVKMTLSLRKVHVFRAYIAGDVVRPGGFVVSGLTRVSDLFAQATHLALRDPLGKFNIQKNEETVTLRTRGIEIHNDLLPVRYADLALFMHSGRVDKNPYLSEGDRVLVAPRKEYVSIHGFINYPGEYDYVSGDCLVDIIHAAGGFMREADSSNIMVSRFMDDFDSLRHMTLTMADSLFELQKDDRILIKGVPDYRYHHTVKIYGYIRYPGVYPIQNDKTSLTDLLEMCGGFTEEADLNYSKIYRQVDTMHISKRYKRLKAVPFENLDPLERSFIKSKMIEQEGLISIPIREIVGSASEKLVLRDKDFIVINRKMLTVQVSGAVERPGLLPYNPGKDEEYYLELAGGKTSHARFGKPVRIMEDGTNILLKASEVDSIRPGDMIFVQGKEFREPGTNLLKVLTVLSTLAAIISSSVTTVAIIREL